MIDIRKPFQWWSAQWMKMCGGGIAESRSVANTRYTRLERQVILFTFFSFTLSVSVRSNSVPCWRWIKSVCCAASSYLCTIGENKLVPFRSMAWQRWCGGINFKMVTNAFVLISSRWIQNSGQHLPTQNSIHIRTKMSIFIELIHFEQELSELSSIAHIRTQRGCFSDNVSFPSNRNVKFWRW